jgi:hypothetical protein
MNIFGFSCGRSLHSLDFACAKLAFSETENEKGKTK